MLFNVTALEIEHAVEIEPAVEIKPAVEMSLPNVTFMEIELAYEMSLL